MARILVLGAGAVGGPVAAWLSDAGHEVHLLARGATAEAIARDGITCVVGGVARTTRVPVVRKLAESPRPDFVVLGVKSTALAEVAGELLRVYGPEVVVVSLLNGMDVLNVLPRRLPHALVALVHWNAWTEAPGRFAMHQRGALVVAPMTRVAEPHVATVADALRQATEVVIAPNARDAVLSKMVLNLSGSLQTLTAFHDRPADDPDALHRLLATLLAEGVRIVRAAGVREVRVPGSPSFTLLRLSAALPRPLTRPIFRRNLAKMRVSSLAQDVARGVRDTELDAIHGELVRLADAFGVHAPLARLVLRELTERLGRPAFEPMRVSELARALDGG